MLKKSMSASKIYDEHGHDYVERRLSENVLFNDFIEAPVVKKLVENNEELAGKHCLDIGCGPGVYARWLLKKKAHVLGIDSSSLMLSAAIRACSPHLGESKSEFVSGTFETYDFGTNTFDIILATFMLGYFSDLKAAFSKMAAMLNKDGRVIASGLHPVRMSSVLQMHDAYVVRDYLSAGIYYADFLGNGSIIPLHKHTFDEVSKAAGSCGLEVTHLLEPHVTPGCDFVDQGKVAFFTKNPSIIVVELRRLR